MRQRQNTVKKIDASLEKFTCKVPECGAELRSDKIKQHYEKRVCFDMFDNLSAIAGDRYVSTGTRYNLGPLHCVEDIIKSVVLRRLDEDNISYKRIMDVKRPDKLKAFGTVLSSSVHTFRKQDELKAHLPLSIWKS